MIIKTGKQAKDLLNIAREVQYYEADPLVYDYPIDCGAVLIRRKTKECLYIKSSGKRNGRTIALQGTVEEFIECEKRIAELEERYDDMRVIDWNEVKEMIKWVPKVPSLY